MKRLFELGSKRQRHFRREHSCGNLYAKLFDEEVADVVPLVADENNEPNVDVVEPKNADQRDASNSMVAYVDMLKTFAGSSRASQQKLEDMLLHLKKLATSNTFGRILTVCGFDALHGMV